MPHSECPAPDPDTALAALSTGAFDRACEPVLVTDMRQRILWCNRPFEMLTGQCRADLQGQPRDRLFAPPGGFGEEEDPALTLDAAEAEGCSCQLRLLRRNGALLTTEATAWPWIDAQGRQIGQIAMFRDRTEWDRQQQAREAHVAILTDQRLDERAKIEAILALACDYFKMPVALVCALEGQMMTVVHAKSSLMTVLPGTRFDVSQGLCRTTLALDGPCSFADTVEIGENPTFLSYGLRSYIGKKLSLGGHTFGTLSLCSPMDHPDFTREDTAMIALFAAGVEQLLATEMRLQALESAATRDWLTGALTNRQFRRDFEDTFARVRRNTATASLILFDVDHFKSINDEFGHDMGDRALTEIARRARRVIGPNRKLYRVGGEEFAVILAGSGADSAAIMAERLRAKISEQGFDDALPLITASFGVAELDPDLDSVDAWLKCADISLYASKNNGRNRVTSNRSISGVEMPSEMTKSRPERQRKRGLRA